MRLGLHIVVLILNDNCYGMIKWKQVGMGFAEYGLSLNNPDFVKYAEAYGAHGHRITQVAFLAYYSVRSCPPACTKYSVAVSMQEQQSCLQQHVLGYT